MQNKSTSQAQRLKAGNNVCSCLIIHKLNPQFTCNINNKNSIQKSVSYMQSNKLAIFFCVYNIFTSESPLQFLFSDETGRDVLDTKPEILY